MSFDLRVLGVNEDDLSDSEWRSVACAVGAVLDERDVEHQGVAPVLNDPRDD